MCLEESTEPDWVFHEVITRNNRAYRESRGPASIFLFTKVPIERREYLLAPQIVSFNNHLLQIQRRSLELYGICPAFQLRITWQQTDNILNQRMWWTTSHHVVRRTICLPGINIRIHNVGRDNYVTQGKLIMRNPTGNTHHKNELWVEILDNIVG